MKAVGVMQWGGPQALQVLELPDPTPGDGEIRIRVHAATVNPTDTALRSGARAGQLRDVPPPYIPGMEAAGVVDRVGKPARAAHSTDSPMKLRVGEHAMAVVRPWGASGAYSELLVAPANSVVQCPAGVTHIQAATLPMNGLTARQALDVLDVPPGETIAVTGGAGAVGGYAIELAKAEGLRIVADGAPADQALLRHLGADIIVKRGPELAERIRRVVPQGVAGIVDAAVLDAAVAPAVRDGGIVATVRGYEARTDRGVTFRPVWVRNYLRENQKLERLREQVEDGQIRLRVARTFPAEQAAEAHQLLENGGVRGRLVLEF